MKVEVHDGTRERSIITGLITDAKVLGRLARKWEGEPFASKATNIVGGLCVKYHKRYGKAPGKAIQGLVESWAAKQKDKASVELVERLLQSISDEYEAQSEESNSDYLLDLAGEHINRVRLQRLKDTLEGELDAGHADKAEALVRGYSKLDVGVGAGVDLFRDKEAVYATFRARGGEVLVGYPGALGEFFDSTLERDAFVAFLAPEKTGKTWMLMDLAFRAVLQRRKVAFFEVGDLSESQTNERFLTRVSQHPMRSPGGKWPRVVRYPTAITPPERGEPGTGFQLAGVTFEEKTFAAALDRRRAWKACCKFMRSRVKSTDSYFMAAVFPNSSIDVFGVEAQLQAWELDSGWSPDVVVIDYADILAAPPGCKDLRDQIDTTWRQLRALSQRRHCLVATATQADAASYGKYLLDRSNFSNDKRILAHATAVYGINVTADEKELGLSRFNCIVAREVEFNPKRCVYTAGCLALANPCVKSTF